MRFSVFTHVVHKLESENAFAYTPYVKEMNYWISNVREPVIVCPVVKENPEPIESPYLHDNLSIKPVPLLYFKSFTGFTQSLVKLFTISLTIFKEMKVSDHIHIRCPGNIGLLACIVQIFFPKKPKTAKYAGNWDPESRQPRTYKLQKWILNNTFLSRNMKVLVYGKWRNSSTNIIPFFTASYSNTGIKNTTKDFAPPYKFLFAGSLAEGKRPLLAVQIIHELIGRGYNINFDIYGEGRETKNIEKYLNENRLQQKVFLHGNQNPEVIQKAFLEAHFVILPSKSEGWPKVLAEGMFFGCIPVATKISCVDWMLNYGERGILIEPDIRLAAKKIEIYLLSEELNIMSQKAQQWSQNYTLEKFNKEIQKFL